MFGLLFGGASFTAQAATEQATDLMTDLPRPYRASVETAPSPWVDEAVVNWFVRTEQCKTILLALRGDETQEVYINGHRLHPKSGVNLCVSPWNVISSPR